MKKFWTTIITYYQLTVETVRSVPYQLSLFWHGATSFDGVFRPRPAFGGLKHVTVGPSTSKDGDATITVAFDVPWIEHFRLGTSSEVLTVASPSQPFSPLPSAAPEPSLLPSSDNTGSPTGHISTAGHPGATSAQSIILVIAFLAFLRRLRFSNRRQCLKSTSHEKAGIATAGFLPEDASLAQQQKTECSDPVKTELELLKQRDDDPEKELKEARETIQQLKKSAEDNARVHQEELDRANVSHRKTTEDLKNNVSELKAKNEQQRQTIYGYTQPKENSTKQKKTNQGSPSVTPSAQHTLTSNYEAFTNAKAKVSSLQTENVGLKEDLDAKEQTIKDQKIEAAGKDASHKKDINKLRNEVSTVRTENTQLKTERDEALKYKISLNKEVAELKDEISNKDASLAELNRANPSKEILKKLLDSQKQENERLVEKQARVEQEKVQVEKEKGQMEQEKARVERQAAQAQAALNDCESKLHKATENNDSLMAENAEIEAAKDTLQNEYALLNQEYNSLFQTNKTVEEERDSLKNEVASLKKDRESTDEANTSLKNLSSSLQTENEILKTEKSSLQEQVETLELAKSSPQNAKDSTTLVRDSPFSETPTVANHDEAEEQQKSELEAVYGKYDITLCKAKVDFHWIEHKKRHRVSRVAQKKLHGEWVRKGLAYDPPTGPAAQQQPGFGDKKFVPGSY